jgi:hypothetical protein
VFWNWVMYDYLLVFFHAQLAKFYVVLSFVLYFFLIGDLQSSVV